MKNSILSNVIASVIAGLILFLVVDIWIRPIFFPPNTGTVVTQDFENQPDTNVSQEGNESNMDENEPSPTNSTRPTGSAPPNTQGISKLKNGVPANSEQETLSEPQEFTVTIIKDANDKLEIHGKGYEQALNSSDIIVKLKVIKGEKYTIKIGGCPEVPFTAKKDETIYRC